MRIYPPMPVTIRRSLKDGMLGRYRIRKDDIILVGTLAAQRDPRVLGAGRRPVRSGPVRDGEGRQPAAPRLHPVLDREAAVHGARGHVHDAPRRPVRDLPPLPAAARAGRDGGEEHGRDDEAGRGADRPPAARAARTPRRGRGARPPGRSRACRRSPAPRPAPRPGGDEPTEIPETSAYRHLVIAYGSNFGANKELAERFAERSHFHGYTSDVITLNELAESPPRTQPWLLVVMTSTYTSNPPSNATAFRAWLERTEPGARDVAQLPVPRLGARQQPVERVPRVPPLRAQEAGRARRHAARGVRLRRRGLAGVGAPARGLERPRLAGAARAVRGAADRGRGRARRGREGGRGRADGRRLRPPRCTDRSLADGGRPAVGRRRAPLRSCA